MKATIHTDGSCRKTGKGSFVAIINIEGIPEYIASGILRDTTSNRAEMHAFIEGIKKAKQLGAMDIEVVSDSMYVLDGIRWRLEVLADPSLASKHQFNKNSDLWDCLIDEVLSVDFTGTWCKGHTKTNVKNTQADRIAGSLSEIKVKKTPRTKRIKKKP